MMKMNKIPKFNFIDSDNIQPKNKRINKHENTICSNCGSNTTSGRWLRTYNKDGSWDRKTYHCAMCHRISEY